MTAGVRCVGKHCLDGPRIEDKPAPRWAVLGLLCVRCHRVLERDLAEMPARLSLLRAHLGGYTTAGRSERPATGSSPVPLNVDAHDLLQAADGALWAWIQLVCEERTLRGPDSHDRASGWLLGQLSWLTGQPWVDDLADELHDLTNECERIIRSAPRRHRLEAPCPSCSTYELGRWDGSDHVDCGSCGRTWDEAHYPSLALVAAQASGGCMTATEAVESLSTTLGAFRMHVSRGRVRKLATIDGVAFYAADDVRALSTQDDETTEGVA